jgi:hypothetical protein
VDACYISYISDTTRENVSHTHRKALARYIGDTPKATLDNRGYVRPCIRRSRVKLGQSRPAWPKGNPPGIAVAEQYSAGPIPN